MKLDDSKIPKLISAHYRVDASLKHLKHSLDRYMDMGLDMDPEYQRGHVWDDENKVKYVEFLLKGGRSPEIQLNCPGWMKDYRGPFEVVDGKQRLTSVMEFIDEKFPVFKGLEGNEKGFFFSEIDSGTLNCASIGFYVNNLEKREQVLQWYLELNEGQIAHSPEELNKVKKLLEQEKQNPMELPKTITSPSISRGTIERK